MTQFYRYLCLGLAGVLLVGMVFSLTGMVFFHGKDEPEAEIKKVTFSSVLDGSCYDIMEEKLRSCFSGQEFWEEKYRDLQDWYTIVDPEAATDPAE